MATNLKIAIPTFGEICKKYHWIQFSKGMSYANYEWMPTANKQCTFAMFVIYPLGMGSSLGNYASTPITTFGNNLTGVGGTFIYDVDTMKYVEATVNFKFRWTNNPPLIIDSITCSDNKPLNLEFYDYVGWLYAIEE